jgi:hypothetical protein
MFSEGAQDMQQIGYASFTYLEERQVIFAITKTECWRTAPFSQTIPVKSVASEPRSTLSN